MKKTISVNSPLSLTPPSGSAHGFDLAIPKDRFSRLVTLENMKRYIILDILSGSTLNMD